MKIKGNISLLVALLCHFSLTAMEKSLAVEPERSARVSSQKKLVTLYIHGTVFTGISYYCHGVNSRPGIQRALAQSNNSLDTFCETLSKSAPEQHPFSHFYWYGWDGKLNEASRMRAAEQLYDWLQENPDIETAIGHSHGATLILLLAKIAQQRKRCTIFHRKIHSNCMPSHGSDRRSDHLTSI